MYWPVLPLVALSRQLPQAASKAGLRFFTTQHLLPPGPWILFCTSCKFLLPCCFCGLVTPLLFHPVTALTLKSHVTWSCLILTVYRHSDYSLSLTFWIANLITENFVVNLNVCHRKSFFILHLFLPLIGASLCCWCFSFFVIKIPFIFVCAFFHRISRN